MDLPLAPGATGEAVRDLQRRLSAVGVEPGDEPGVYGPATATAVGAFQRCRGLPEDGVCGPTTWSALVEAGYHLGDRTLYLAQPMLRGDDVADLQRRLGALGFDAGRVDGILGPQTERALLDFQRNAGLVVDGICGPETVTAVRRLGARQTGSGEPVVGVRERAALRLGSKTLEGRVVAVGDFGGLGALVHELARTVGRAGARAVVAHHPEGSEQAAQANAIDADVYLGVLLALDEPVCSTAFYRGHGWESPAGRRLAELIQARLPAVLAAADGGVSGMAVPVLRETRMPAVLCELGPARSVVERAPMVAANLVEALAAWVAPTDT